MPPFLGPMLQDHLAEFGRYPPIRGIPALRQAIADWMGRRYPLLAGQIDPERHVLPLNGSREGLFSADLSRDRTQAFDRAACSAHPQSLLPGLRGGSGSLWRSTSLPRRAPRRPASCPSSMLSTKTCSSARSPSISARPRTRKARSRRAAYLAQAIALARAHDFLLFADECYSEIYGDVAPPGALETAYAETGSLANVVVFQSLSKRSGLPGLRSGFVAGDPDFIAAFGRFRNVACPQVPLPIQHVSVAAWSDEEHVEQGRALYRANFDLADAILGLALRLSTAGRSLLSLARFGRFRGRRGGRDNPLERLWCQSAAGSLSRAGGTRRGQSRQGLRQGRARA